MVGAAVVAALSETGGGGGGCDPGGGGAGGAIGLIAAVLGNVFRHSRLGAGGGRRGRVSRGSGTAAGDAAGARRWLVVELARTARPAERDRRRRDARGGWLADVPAAPAARAGRP